MLKKFRFLFAFSFILLFVFSACKEEEGSGLGGQMFEDFVVVSEPFTQQDINVLNETLNITLNNLPNYNVRHAGHSGKEAFSTFINPYSATVGRVLFYDKTLSKDSTVSCASCHQQSLAFGDDKDFSIGVNGNLTNRNAIALGAVTSFVSTYNSSDVNLNHHLFWDERAETTNAQISETFQNNKEMGMFMWKLVNRVKERPEYQILFKIINQEGTISENTIANALSDFMNAINSQKSFLDQSLSQMGMNASINQDIIAFNNSQQLGRKIFNVECKSCHAASISPNLTIPFTAANNGLDIEYLDKGIGAITNNVNENGVFKIPNLRNIEVTGPYMHDGRFETLEEVIDFYSTGIQAHPNLHSQLKDINGAPKKFLFTEEEKEALIVFLETMTDQTLILDPKFSDPFKQ